MKLIITILISVLSFNVLLSSERIYVSLKGNDDNNGKTWSTAVKSPAKAIELANPTQDKPVEIWIAEGIYPVKKTLEMKSNLKFIGGFKGNEKSKSQLNIKNRSVLNGLKKNRLLDFKGEKTSISNTEFENISFVNAYYEEEGSDLSAVSKIYHSKNIIFRNCLFTMNNGDPAGNFKIAVSKDILFENCIFEEVPGSWVSILISYSQNANFKSCVFMNNNSQQCHIFFCADGGSSTFENCVFVNNSTRHSLFHIINGYDLTILNCVFVGNFASKSNVSNIFNTDNNSNIKVNVINTIFTEDVPKSKFTKQKVKKNKTPLFFIGENCQINVDYSILPRDEEFTNKKGNKTNLHKNPKLLPLDYYGKNKNILTMPIAQGSPAINAGASQSDVPLEVILPEKDVLGNLRNTEKRQTIGAVQTPMSPPRR